MFILRRGGFAKYHLFELEGGNLVVQTADPNPVIKVTSKVTPSALKEEISYSGNGRYYLQG